MSWLRVDDRFTEHPKVLRLGGAAARWTWLEILAYVARNQTDGLVPKEVTKVVRGATPAFLRKCHDTGLLEQFETEYVVHDWPLYNENSIGEKVDYYLSRHPEASANDVYRELGGKRELVLLEVRRNHETGSLGTTPKWYRGTAKVVPEVVHARVLPAPTTPEEPEGPDVQDKIQVQVKTPSNGTHTTTRPAWNDDDLDLTPISHLITPPTLL